MKKIEFTGERYLPTLTEMMINLEHLSRYYAFAVLCKNKVVLDAACGMGYGSNHLADFADRVFGIDIAADVIENNTENYRKNNLMFQVASIEKLPFEDQFFDTVISLETIEHVDMHAQRNFLEEVKRVLKEDGCFVVSTPDKKFYTDAHPNWKNQFHIHEFYYDEFYTFLSHYFKNVNILKQNIYPASIIWNPKSIQPLQINGLIEGNDKQIHYCDPQRFDYLIAVCSDAELPDVPSLVTADVQYKLIMDYIRPYAMRVNELEERLRKQQPYSSFSITV